MLNATAYIMNHFQQFNLFQTLGIKSVRKDKDGIIVMSTKNASCDELHVCLDSNDSFQFQTFKKGKGGLMIKGIHHSTFREVVLRTVLPGWNTPLKSPFSEDAIDTVDAMMFTGDPTSTELDKITYIAARWLKHVAMCREYSTLD